MATPTQSLTKETNDALHTEAGDRSIRYMDTATAYDLWSEVYDTDGNFLQALDTIEMEEMLPHALSLLSTSPPASNTSGVSNMKGIKVIDLGCGTGRNTVKLLDHANLISEIVAVDLSPKMLEIARQRCLTMLESNGDGGSNTSPSISSKPAIPTLTFSTYDMINQRTPPASFTRANFVISTLVLEHIPLPTFFRIVSSFLTPGGMLLLTNMHAKMGQISQAGFVDPKTGDKIRPVSYAHRTDETIAEAEKWGLDVIGGVKQVKMTGEMVRELGVRSEKWIGVDVWFGGIWKKR